MFHYIILNIINHLNCLSNKIVFKTFSNQTSHKISGHIHHSGFDWSRGSYATDVYLRYVKFNNLNVFKDNQDSHSHAAAINSAIGYVLAGLDVSKRTEMSYKPNDVILECFYGNVNCRYAK